MQKNNKQSSTPFFSIGITTYNRKKLLKECIESILCQTFTDFEIIIGNDYVKETLSYEDLDSEDPRIRIVNHTTNLGELDNLNMLLKISRGRYFTWQADDDFYAPNFLQEVYKAIITHGNDPKCLLTSFNVVRDNHIFKQIHDKIISVKKVRIFDGQKFMKHYWNGGVKVMGFVGVYTKAYLMGIGGLKRLTNMPIAIFSEYMLLMEISLLREVIYIDAPLIYYRAHDESWSASVKDYEAYKIAGINFLKMSIEIFKSPAAGINYFRRNLSGVMKIVLGAGSKICARNGSVFLSLSYIKYLGTLKSIIWSLKGTGLFFYGIQSLCHVTLWFLLLYFPQVLLITIMPDSIRRVALKLRSYVHGEIT